MGCIKRWLSLSCLALACAAVALPATATAGKGRKHRSKKAKRGKRGKKGKWGKGKWGKGKRGKGKRGKGKKGKGGGGEDNEGGGEVELPGDGFGERWKVRGAGQRLHFTFGGAFIRDTAGIRGQFVLDVHPLAPTGTTLSLACRYTDFVDFIIEDNVATFEARGRCRRLDTAGEISMVDVHNEFRIVDNGDSGDLIDVEFVGTTGIAVPGGALDFGNLEVLGAY